MRSLVVSPPTVYSSKLSEAASRSLTCHSFYPLTTSGGMALSVLPLITKLKCKDTTIYIIMMLFSLSSAMFFPVIQSFLFQQVTDNAFQPCSIGMPWKSRRIQMPFESGFRWSRYPQPNQLHYDVWVAYPLSGIVWALCLALSACAVLPSTRHRKLAPLVIPVAAMPSSFPFLVL